MITVDTQVRVRYSETDQMGVVYYGNYAQYYEVGRVEWIRHLGMTYKSLEESGVFMPVVEMHLKFLRSAKYDDLLTIKTTLKEIPENHKITFHQELFNEKNELLNAGFVSLFFMDAATQKKCPMPNFLKEKLAPHFS